MMSLLIRPSPDAFTSSAPSAGSAKPSRRIASAKRCWSWPQAAARPGRSDIWDRHQSACHLIFFGTPADLGVEFGDLVVEVDLRLDQDQQRCPSFLGQAACRILYDCNQARCVRCALWNHLGTSMSSGGGYIIKATKIQSGARITLGVVHNTDSNLAPLLIPAPSRHA